MNKLDLYIYKMGSRLDNDYLRSKSGRKYYKYYEVINFENGVRSVLIETTSQKEAVRYVKSLKAEQQQRF